MSSTLVITPERRAVFREIELQREYKQKAREATANIYHNLYLPNLQKMNAEMDALLKQVEKKKQEINLTKRVMTQMQNQMCEACE